MFFKLRLPFLASSLTNCRKILPPSIRGEYVFGGFLITLHQNVARHLHLKRIQSLPPVSYEMGLVIADCSALRIRLISRKSVKNCILDERVPVVAEIRCRINTAHKHFTFFSFSPNILATSSNEWSGCTLK